MVAERLQHVLVGVRYRLLPFTEAHISDRYIGWLNDTIVNRFTDHVRWVRQTHETVLAYVRSFYQETEKYMWGVSLGDTGELIGTATLAAVNRHHGSGGIGLMIGEQRYWGQGASIEAIELMERFAFETLGLRRLTAVTLAPNHAMNFSLKRLGFTMEGKLRQAFRLSSGDYVDGYCWALLAEEWSARRQAAVPRKMSEVAP